MNNTWIVVANKSEARIYNAQKSLQALEEVETVNNVAARMREADLTSDKAGAMRDSSAGSGPRTYRKEETALSHSLELYTHQLSKMLGKAIDRNKFSHLLLVAEPGYLGVLNKELQRRSIPVSATVGKEFSHLSSDKLYHTLESEIKSTFH